MCSDPQKACFYIVPLFRLFNFYGFMLSADNNPPHGTHFGGLKLFSLVASEPAWVIFLVQSLLLSRSQKKKVQQLSMGLYLFQKIHLCT